MGAWLAPPRPAAAFTTCWKPARASHARGPHPSARPADPQENEATGRARERNGNAARVPGDPRGPSWPEPPLSLTSRPEALWGAGLTGAVPGGPRALLPGPQALMVPPAQRRAPEPLPSPFQALSHCRHGDRGAWAAAWASAQRPRPSGTGRNDTPGLFITQRDGPPHLAQGPLGVPHPTSQPSAQSVLCAQLLLCAGPLYMAQDSATSVWLLADMGREMSLWSLKLVPRPVGWLCSGQEKCHACPPRLSTASVPVRVPAGTGQR